MRSVYIFLPQIQIAKIINALDAVGKRKPGSNDEWIIGEDNAPVIQIGIESTLEDLEKDNLDSASEALGTLPSIAVFADVSGNFDGRTEVRQLVVEFVSRLGVGVAQDDFSTHSWKLDEIKGDKQIQGKKFFTG